MLINGQVNEQVDKLFENKSEHIAVVKGILQQTVGFQEAMAKLDKDIASIKQDVIGASGTD